MEKICKTNIDDLQCESLLLTVGDALYVIGGKWKLRVIIALFNGSKRFNEINRKVKGISARVLSNELKELERNGFVRRTVHVSATPVIVDYELTTYSYSLEKVVFALSEWGTGHRAKIREQHIEEKMYNAQILNQNSTMNNVKI